MIQGENKIIRNDRVGSKVRENKTSVESINDSCTGNTYLKRLISKSRFNFCTALDKTFNLKITRGDTTVGALGAP